jgi:hypothetical protein
MIQFQHLAMVVAGELGIHRGTHTVTANSLHTYKELHKETSDVVLRTSFPVEVLDQGCCNSPITYGAVLTLTAWIERKLESEVSLDTLGENLPYYEDNYWTQLAMMPVLYDYRLRGVERAELVTWMTDNMPDIFVWLAKDLWFSDRWVLPSEDI